MAFIQNPLGGGYYGQLPNLTEGVQALQRTEIQRRLNDIQQQKQWDIETIGSALKKWLLMRCQLEE